MVLVALAFSLLSWGSDCRPTSSPPGGFSELRIGERKRKAGNLLFPGEED